MSIAISFDEELARSFPLPLAQLYRRAHNAKTPLERHLTAYYLWEAGLKLLGAVAIAEFAELPEHDPEIADRLTCLARPALGHWWEFVRRLAPVLAARDDTGFTKIRDLLFGRPRSDFPRAANLDSALRGALGGPEGPRTTLRLSDLFDRLIQYRNRELGHGAAGSRPEEFYERIGTALLGGVSEVLGRLDVLAGRQLLYVAEVRQTGGVWLLQRFALSGENALRIESLELAHSEALALPHAELLYLQHPSQSGSVRALRSLHPLLIYDFDANEALFLNSRQQRQRAEYLSYTTGRVVNRSTWGVECREFLARILGISVDDQQLERFEAQSEAEEPKTSSTEPPSTRQLGEFELRSLLGRGGMGVVYRAWQPSLGRQVAVKCMARIGDAKAEARFAREIHALGRVEHPHLVKIHTSGTAGEQWFYAMELLDGVTLCTVCDKLAARGAKVEGLDTDSWREVLSNSREESRQAEPTLDDNPVVDCRARPKSTQTFSRALVSRTHVCQCVELIRQVAGAAHALHKAGVIHRDIKPGNIMVSLDGAHAVLMDLGLAQLADDLDGRLTRTRQFVGTLRYASPEQVLSVGRLDCRSDVYSLGATLWELLTLQPIYGATDQTPTAELMRRIQFEESVPLRKYHPGIARDLDAIVQKCLEKNPDRRYPTAQELAADLGHFLADEPIRARPANLWRKAVRWCRRHSLACQILGFVVCQPLLLSLFNSVFSNDREDVGTGVGAGLGIALAAVAGFMGTVRALLACTSNRQYLKRATILLVIVLAQCAALPYTFALLRPIFGSATWIVGLVWIGLDVGIKLGLCTITASRLVSSPSSGRHSIGLVGPSIGALIGYFGAMLAIRQFNEQFSLRELLGLIFWPYLGTVAVLGGTLAVAILGGVVAAKFNHWWQKRAWFSRPDRNP